MRDITHDGLPVAHGACVALGTLSVLALYDWLLRKDLTGIDVEALVRARQSMDESLQQVEAAFQKILDTAAAESLAFEGAIVEGVRPKLNALPYATVFPFRTPPIPGLVETGFHTSDSIMRLPELPKRLGIIGGGFIAVEMGHVFSAFGSDVTIINRSPTLLARPASRQNSASQSIQVSVVCTGVRQVSQYLFR